MNPKFADLAFDAVLPSAILFNDNLEPNAIKLYAFVRGLSRLEGYCFATNAYLAECMNCDESTVKRLLGTLKTEKFIEIHTDKNGIHWQRKIYISSDFKKCLRRLKNEPPPAQNQAPPSSKMSPIYIEDIQLEIEDKKEPPTSSPACPQPEAADVVSLLIEAIRKTKPDLKEPNWKKWLATIDRMLRIDKRSLGDIRKVLEWLPTSEFWSLNILSAESFRSKFDKLQLQCLKGNAPNSLSKASNLIQRLKDKSEVALKLGIEINDLYVDFNMPGEYYRISDKTFVQDVVHSFRKRGAPPKFIAYLETGELS